MKISDAIRLLPTKTTPFQLTQKTARKLCCLSICCFTLVVSLSITAIALQSHHHSTAARWTAVSAVTLCIPGTLAYCIANKAASCSWFNTARQEPPTVQATGGIPYNRTAVNYTEF